MKESHGIPAANIREVDLEAITQRFPDVAEEIKRLSELMRRGEDSTTEFCRLCELLCAVGEAKESEYLLRRNLECHDETQVLYKRLFGSTIPDNFQYAIERFAEEFGLNIQLQVQRGFLDQGYSSSPADSETPRFNILKERCDIRFDYSQRDFVVAEITAGDVELSNFFDLNTCLFLRWQDQKWRLIDPREA